MNDHGSNTDGSSKAGAIRERDTEPLLTAMTSKAEEQASRLASVLRCTPDHLYLYDTEGRFVYVSDAALQALGLTLTEMVGRTGRELGFPPELTAELEERSLEAMRSGRPSSGDVVFPLSTGARDFEYRVAPVIGSDGASTGVVVTARDVTDRVRAEAAVREGRDEFERRVEERTRELEAANLRLRRTERALLTLSWSNQTLVRAVDERHLLQDVCDTAIEVGGYRMAWVGYLEHDEAQSILPAAFAGAERGFFDEISVGWGAGPTGQGSSGRCVRELRPAIVTDIAADPAYWPWREAAEQRGYGSVVSLPLLDPAGEAFGVFVLFAGEKDAFDDREVALLEELSMDLAYGIDSLRSRLKRTEAEVQLHESYAKLETLTRDVVVSMGRIVEARDPYTQGHERRVAQLVKLIAAEMGLSEDEIAAVEMAALLHDIGKLCVPAEILTKPGTLSFSEFELIKDHSRRGYEILKDISFPWPIADIVLQHHERMDGSGYPAGEQGDDISMAARILAVADVIEAMASHRPYRPLIGIAQAMDEIRERPSAYDPDVTAACERLFERGQIELWGAGVPPSSMGDALRDVS